MSSPVFVMPKRLELCHKKAFVHNLTEIQNGQLQIIINMEKFDFAYTNKIVKILRFFIENFIKITN